MVFLISGVSLILISCLYIQSKKLRELDVLYKTEIKKVKTAEEREDKVAHQNVTPSRVD